jgi:hypothetical protein
MSAVLITLGGIRRLRLSRVVAAIDTLEVRRNFIALGCPIKDVLDFGGHFLPLGWCSFFKRGVFPTATGVYTIYGVSE